MSSWTISCGWNFAQKSTDFYFVSGSVSDKLKCSKCDTLRSCAASQKGQELRTGFEDDALAGTSTSVPANARKRRHADRTNSTKWLWREGGSVKSVPELSWSKSHVRMTMNNRLGGGGTIIINLCHFDYKPCLAKGYFFFPPHPHLMGNPATRAKSCARALKMMPWLGLQHLSQPMQGSADMQTAPIRQNDSGGRVGLWSLCLNCLTFSHWIGKFEVYPGVPSAETPLTPRSWEERLRRQRCHGEDLGAEAVRHQFGALKPWSSDRPQVAAATCRKKHGGRLEHHGRNWTTVDKATKCNIRILGYIMIYIYI